MAENIIIPAAAGKKSKYELLIPQVKALVQGEQDSIANLSNIMAALKYGMGYFWVGCYFVKNNELVLGPFQGPVACTRIAYGKGVCGKSWELKEVLIVEDVEKFPGHIACSKESRSEIVLPAFNKKGDVVLVLDIDSNRIGDFDETDKYYLLQVIGLMEEIIAG